MCFLNLHQQMFFYFVVFDQFNVLLLITLLLYFHKIGEYVNKDHSLTQTSYQKGESDKSPVQSLIKEKDDRIALNKGPTISPAKKGGPKKESTRILKVLMKDTTA